MNEKKFEQRVTSLFEIREQIKSLQEVEKAILTELKDSVKAGETHEVGDLVLVASPNRRFNEKKAREWLGADELKQVEETKINAAKFKALFADLYEQAQDEHPPKISVKRQED